MAVFVRVAGAGSMSAAGRALGMSPAMVSKRIAQLEARLGVRLLNRTTRRLSLTAEGAAFQERSTRILADIEETEAAVSGMRGKPRGTLRFTAGATFARLHLGPLFADFPGALSRYQAGSEFHRSGRRYRRPGARSRHPHRRAQGFKPGRAQAGAQPQRRLRLAGLSEEIRRTAPSQRSRRSSLHHPGANRRPQSGLEFPRQGRADRGPCQRPDRLQFR